METERLIIDRIGESDREDYFYNISHDRKVLETFVCRYAETLEDFDFSNYLNRDDLFAIRLKETGRLIGIVLYFDEKDGACEIGYGIGSTHWNKGYATEAVRRFLTYLFDEKGMQTVTASYFTGNDASRRVMEKCGMTYQRFSPQEFEYHGAMRDLTYYAIESKPGGDRARIESFWHSVLRQDREALPQYFTPDAEVFWHCTNERFTAEEFIRVNCDYPGEWDGEIERFEPTPAGCVTAVHVFSKDRSVSCRVTSFFTFQGKRIARLDEYWADDGPVPDWRRTMRVGRPIR